MRQLLSRSTANGMYTVLIAAVVSTLLATLTVFAVSASLSRDVSAQTSSQTADSPEESTEDQPDFTSQDAQGSRKDFVQGKLIVKTSNQTGNQRIKATNRQTDSRTVESIPEGDIKVVDLPENLSVRQAQRRYERQPGVEYAEPDYKLYPSQMDSNEQQMRNSQNIQPQAIGPDDPQFPKLYGLNNSGQTGGEAGADIGAVDAWDKTTGTSDVTVAVIDTGMNIRHPDLRENIYINRDEVPSNGIDDDDNGFVDDTTGWDFFNQDNTVYDDPDTDLHGTHVGGTLGASGDNGQGVAGVNWDVSIMPLKFLGPKGGTTLDAIKAINYAVDNGATISNNSWGGGPRSQALKETLTRAERSGHLFVTSAGNDYANSDINPYYPAAYNNDNVISVAATDDEDGLADFSNRGANSVDLGAPGARIFSTLPPGSEVNEGRPYGYLSGTSMASPHVAGTAALIKSEYPGAGEERLKRKILGSVDPVESLQGNTVTGGRLNADRALSRGTVLPPTQSGSGGDESGSSSDSSDGGDGGGRVPPPEIRPGRN